MESSVFGRCLRIHKGWHQTDGIWRYHRQNLRLQHRSATHESKSVEAQDCPNQSPCPEKAVLGQPLLLVCRRWRISNFQHEVHIWSKFLFRHVFPITSSLPDLSDTQQVPFFQTETRLQFKFLGHYHADKRITTLYNYKFKKHERIQLDELQLLRELE